MDKELCDLQAAKGILFILFIRQTFLIGQTCQMFSWLLSHNSYTWLTDAPDDLTEMHRFVSDSCVVTRQFFLEMDNSVLFLIMHVSCFS